MQEFARYTAYYGNYSYCYILLCQLISQNIAGNYSTVKLQAIIQVNGANYISWASGNATLHTDSFELDTMYYNGNTLVHEMIINISHESNGTKTQYIGGSINTSYLMNGICGGNITLPTIPRYPSFSECKVSEVKPTTVSITWNSTTQCDALQYSLNGSAWMDISGYPVCTIEGLKPNTNYQIKIRIRSKESQLWTESSMLEVKTLGVPVRLFIDGIFKEAIPYIWKNNEWKIAIPYIWKNSEWKRGK